MNIRYLIIDDESIAHDIIKNYCALLPNMQLMKHCYDALEAFEYLSKNEADLIFLDLNMPVLKGFEFLRTLNNPPKVIITTAHKEYALEGYEYNISDYLLKPFGFERFLKAINKAFGESNPQYAEAVYNDPGKNRIFVQSNKTYIQLETNSILYIESIGNYTKIITSTETITVREKISTLLELLPPKALIQVHKSYAVAPNHIKRIEGNCISLSGHSIPIGSMYKMNVLGLLKK